MASYILLHFCDGSRTATTFINTPGAIPALLDVYGSLGDAKDSAMLLELSSIITGICIKPTPQTLPRLQPIVPVLLSKFRSNSNPLLTAYICKALGRLCDGQKEIAESVLAANVSSYLLFLYWNAVDSERRRQQRQDVDDVLFEDIFGLLGLLAFYEKPQAQRLLAPLPTFPASAPFSLTPPDKEKKGKESSASSELGRSIVWSGVRRTDAEVYAEQDAVIAGYMKLQTAPDLVDIISVVLDLVLEPAEPASPPSSTDWYYVQCAAWQISMILTNGMAVRDSLHRRQRLINSLVFKKMLRCIDRHAAAMPSACLCALSQALSYSVLGASSVQIGYLVCEGLLHTLLLIAQHGKTSRKCLLCVLHAVNAILSMGERDRLPGRKGDVWDDLDGGGDGLSSDDDDDGDEDAWWGQDAQRQQSSDEEYVAAESEKRRKGEGDVVEERTRGVRRRRKREPERKSSRSSELPDERKDDERKEDDQAKDAQQQRKQGRSRVQATPQSQSLPQSEHPASTAADAAISADASLAPSASPSSSSSLAITSPSPRSSAPAERKAQPSSCSHCQSASDNASSFSSSTACSCSTLHNGYVLLLRLFQAESVFRRLELSTSKRSSKEDQALLALIRKLLAFFQHTPDDRLDNPFMQQLTHAAAEPAAARIASPSPSSSSSPAPALSFSLSSLSFSPLPESSSESAVSASASDEQSESPPRPAFRRSLVRPAERQRLRWRRERQEEAAQTAYHHKRKELRFLLTGVRGELPGGLQRQPLPSPQKAKHKSRDDSTALVTAAAGGAGGSGAKAEAARKSSIEDLIRGMQEKERQLSATQQQRRTEVKETNRPQTQKDSKELKDAPSSPAVAAPPAAVPVAAAAGAVVELEDEEGEDDEDDDDSAVVSGPAGGDERARRVKDKRAKKKEKAKQQKRKAVKAAKTRSERAQVDYKTATEPELPAATAEEEEQALEERRKREQEEQEAARQQAAAAAQLEQAALEAQRKLEKVERARQQKLEEEQRRLQQEKAEKEREEAEREKERKAQRLQEEETQRLEKQRKQQEKAEVKAKEEKRKQEEARERDRRKQEKLEAEQAAAAVAHQHRHVYACRFPLCPHRQSITAADLLVQLTCTAHCHVRFHHSAPTSPSRSQLSCWQLLPSSSSPSAPSLASLLADGAALPCPTPDCDGVVRDVSVRRGEDDSVVSQLLHAPPPAKKAAEQDKETKAQRKQRRRTERLKLEEADEQRRREFAREERKEDAAAAAAPVVLAVEETRKAVRGFEVVVHAKEKDLVPVIPRPALFSAAADETKESRLPSSPSSASTGSGSAAPAPHRSEKKGRQARLTRIDIFLPEAEPEEEQEPEETAAVQQQQQQQQQAAVPGYPVQVSSTAYGGVVRCLPSGSSSRLLYIRSLDSSSHPDADVEALSSWIVSQCSLIAPVFVTRFYAPTAVLVQYASTAQAERAYSAFRECMAMQFAAEPASIVSSDELRQAAAYQAIIASKQRQETEAAQRSVRSPPRPTLPYRPQPAATRSAALPVTTAAAPSASLPADKSVHVPGAASPAADYAELDAEQFDFSFLGIGGDDEDEAVEAAGSETPSPPMPEPVAILQLSAPDKSPVLPTHSFTSFSSSWSSSPSQSSSSAWASPSHTPGQSSAFPSLPSMAAVFSPLQNSAATPPSSSSSLFSPSSPANKAPPLSSLTPALDPILSPASSSVASSLFAPASPELASSSLRASVSIRTPYFSSSSLFSSSASASAESPSSSLFSLPSFSMFAAPASAAAAASELQTASAVPTAAASFFSSSAAASTPSQAHLAAPPRVLAADPGDEDDDDVWGDEKLSRLILKSDAEDDDDAQLAGVPTHPRHDSIADSTDGLQERPADDDVSDARTNSDTPSRYDEELDQDFSAQREAAEQRAAADDDDLNSSGGSQSFVRDSSGDYDERHLRHHFSQPQQRQVSPSPLPPRFSRPGFPPPQGLTFSQQPPPRLPHPHAGYAGHPSAASVSMEQPAMSAMYGVNGSGYGGWSGAMPSSPQPLPAGYSTPPHAPYGFPAAYGAGGGSMYGYSNGGGGGVGVVYPVPGQQSYGSPLMHPHYVQMMLARQMLARGRAAAPLQPSTLAPAAGKGQPVHAGGIAMLEMNGEQRQLSGGGQYAPQQQEEESERWQSSKRGYVVDLEADFPSLAAVSQPAAQPPSYSRQSSALSSPSSAQSSAASMLADEPSADSAVSAASASSPSSAGGEGGVSWTNHIASKLKTRHEQRAAHTAATAVSPSSAHHDGLAMPAKASPSQRSQPQSHSPSQQQATTAAAGGSWPQSSGQPRRPETEADSGHHRTELKGGDKRRTPSKGGAGGSEWTEVVAAGKKKRK